MACYLKLKNNKLKLLYMASIACKQFKCLNKTWTCCEFSLMLWKIFIHLEPSLFYTQDHPSMSLLQNHVD